MTETLNWPYRILILGYCLILFVLSHQSEAPESAIGLFDIAGLDKVAHAVLYAGLACCCSFGLRRSNLVVRTWVQCFIPIIFVMLYGLSDEIHQLFVPKRRFDWWDWCADVAGACAAQFVLCKWVWKL